MNKSEGPLNGLNVIDFGHYYAGPIAGMLLAEQGANVLRVLKPGSLELDEDKFNLVNRNKSTITLDLKTSEGISQAKALIEKADVLIENFRPFVMEKLGLGYKDIKKINPGLIYVSLPGFSALDKDRRHIQAWEGVMAAAAGVYTHTSPYRYPLGFPPVYTSVMNCSIYGAVQAAIGTMAALIARDGEAKGHGTFLEIPLSDGAIFGFSIPISFSGPDPKLPEHLQHLAFNSDEMIEDQLHKLEEAAVAMGDGVGSHGYVCADGRQIFPHACDNARFLIPFYKTLGLYEKLLSEGYVFDQWVSGLDNNLCTSNGLSKEKRERVEKLIEDALQSKTAAEWEVAFQNAGCPAAMVRTRKEWLSLDELLTSEVFTKMNLTSETDAIVPARTADVGEISAGSDSGFRPPQSVTFEVASKAFGHSDNVVPRGDSPALNKGDLLKGLKVLDLANVAAGPTGALVLAGYGAEVTKVDPISGYTPGPGFTIAARTLNRGKRSILINSKSVVGKEVLNKLISEADILHHNILDDACERLGISFPQIQSINPGMVTCQLSCLGGSRRGGQENRLGLEPILSCASGMNVHFGTLQAPHWHGQASNVDIVGGFCMAFIELVGIYNRGKTGCGAETRTSLAKATNLMQLPSMILNTRDNSIPAEPGGQLAVGESWYQRMYKCRDRWIYIGATSQNANTLLKLIPGNEPEDGEEAEAIEAALVKEDYLHWIEKLDAADIACHLVRDARDILALGTPSVGNEDANVNAEQALNIYEWKKHPSGIPLVAQELSNVMVGEKRSFKRLASAERLGSSTREILRDLGFNQPEIEHLIKIRGVSNYLENLGPNRWYFGQEVADEQQ